jgi:hypothetical protein
MGGLIQALSVMNKSKIAIKAKIAIKTRRLVLLLSPGVARY